jgi:hypothetical protein
MVVESLDTSASSDFSCFAPLSIRFMSVSFLRFVVTVPRLRQVSEDVHSSARWTAWRTLRAAVKSLATAYDDESLNCSSLLCPSTV